MLARPAFVVTQIKKNGIILHQNLGVSPDEKIFTPTDERGFLPYTPHPTLSFKSGDRF
jgi:hypothetical protein